VRKCQNQNCPTLASLATMSPWDRVGHDSSSEKAYVYEQTRRREERHARSIEIPSENTPLNQPRRANEDEMDSKHEFGLWLLCILCLLVLAHLFISIIQIEIGSQPSCMSAAECATQRRQWELEEQARLKREREERQRQRLSAGMSWETPAAEHCTAYSVRQYSAQLMNIPVYEDWVEACNMTAVTIHNITFDSPQRCEDRGFWGGVHGYWSVAFDEPACIPYWGPFEYKNCVGTGSGKRWVSSRLWNVNTGDDWDSMCASTPTEINSIRYATPTSCENKLLGVWGHWDIPDSECN